MADSRNYKTVGEYTTWGKLLPQLDGGDLVEMDRGPIRHWAVFVQSDAGNGIVVHVTGDVGSGFGAVVGARNTIADIRVEVMATVVGASPCRVNNSVDERHEPYGTGVQVVKRGLSKLGQHDYSVWHNNCEHWASWCRNSHLVSLQAEERIHQAEELVLKAEKDSNDLKHKAEKNAEDLKKKAEKDTETLKEKMEAKAAELKGMVEEFKAKAPVFQLPNDVKIPDEMLAKMPFLKKYEEKTD